MANRLASVLVAASVPMITRSTDLPIDGEHWHCRQNSDWGNVCADAHIFHADNYLACDSYKVTAADLQKKCTADDPCITAYVGIPDFQSPECGKCFKITMVEDGIPWQAPAFVTKDPVEAVCNVPEGAETCAPYEATVYVKAMDETSAAHFEVAQNAWDIMCPYCCNASSVCSQTAEQCVHGVIPENWRCSYKGIKYEEVVCGQSEGSGSSTTSTTKAGDVVPTTGDVVPSTTLPACPAGYIHRSEKERLERSVGGDVAAHEDGEKECLFQMDCSINANCELGGTEDGKAAQDQWCREHGTHNPPSCPEPHCYWTDGSGGSPSEGPDDCVPASAYRATALISILAVGTAALVGY